VSKEPTTETVGADTAVAKKRPGMGDVFRSLGQPKIAIMLALGFSSGLPFLLTAGTFGYWLREAGTSLAAIGFLSWVGLAYTLKFLWAPIIDRFDAPILGKLLGRRRGWMVIAQVLVGIGLIAMAAITPAGGLGPMAVAALVVAFASATQDIVVDAWRIEAADNSEELGLLSSAYQLGYRVAIIVADALILIIAKFAGWSISYWVMAAFMVIGLVAVFLAKEPPPVVREEGEDRRRIGRREFWLYNLFVLVGGLGLFGVIYALQLLHGVWEQTGFKPETARGAELIVVLLLLIPVAIFGIRRCHDRGRPGAWILLLIVPVAVQIFWLLKHGLMAGTLPDVAAEFASGEVHWLTWLALASFAGELWWLIDLGLLKGAPEPNRWGVTGSPRPAGELLWGTFEPAVGPFLQFFKVYGWVALLMFTFITLYRLPEFVMGPMATPFYSDLGIDKAWVGTVRGTFGLAGSIFGIAVGGLLVARLGYLRGLIVGGFFQAFAIAGFALPAIYGNNPALFAAVMAFDNFGVSIAGVALVTYMSTLTSVGYTAVQYAVLSSAYAFVGKIVKGFSGQIVEGIQAAGHSLMQSYAIFFVGAGAGGLPAILLCIWLTLIARKQARERGETAAV
jgi:uncharacterized membrane protein YhaH (DUF805 family)